MSLTHKLLGTAVLLLGACGPERGDDDWMLDTFSQSRGAGNIDTNSALGKFTFEPDGTGTRTSIGSCGSDVDDYPFIWERRDGLTIAIVPYPGEEFVFNTNEEEWRFTPTGVCSLTGGVEEIQWQEIQDGQVVLDALVFRGDVCLERFEPSPEDCPPGYECDDCRTVWCDEAPPPCEEESS